MSKLPFHEWLIICLLIAVLMMLTFITLIRKPDRLPPVAATHELSAQTVYVIVKGAVVKEGSYELKKGALMKDVLELAKPLPDADLTRINLDARLRDNQVVKVPVQNWITIHVEGAGVEPATLRVKLGTLLKDLPDRLTFLPEADIKKLNKKRRLKDQEIIQVPVKKDIKPRYNSRQNKKEQAENP